MFIDDLKILGLLEDGFPRKIYDKSNYFDEMNNITFFRNLS